MTQTVRISVFCSDRTGLVAEITGHLFDSGANLKDTLFSVLGTGAEFTSVCEIPDDLDLETLKLQLSRLPELESAEINITKFELQASQQESANITHRITIGGGDQPGLVARLCETFIEFEANIVRLTSSLKATGDYEIRISVNIPPGRETACLATIGNTAEGLQLTCTSEEV